MNFNSYNLIKFAYTFFILILVPVYWIEYGVTNFLWFSDVTLFMTLIALWTRNNMLVSMASIWFLPFTLLWNIDFFGRFIFGYNILGITNYMFDKSILLFIRGLSLFHMWLPLLLIWMLYKLKYNKDAILYISMVTWVTLPVTYLLTEPARNINWVFGIKGNVQNVLHPLVYLVMLMIIIPILIYCPMHCLLKNLFKKIN